MTRLRFPKPMTCEQVRGLFAGLLAEDLDAERRGRVEGHLLACEECSAAFAEAIDQAFAQGILPQHEVPPVPIPVLLPQYGLFGRGVVKVPLWDAVKRATRGAMEVPERAAAATVEAVCREVGEVRQLLANLERCWLGALHLWPLAPAFAFERTMGTMAGEAVLVQHLNEAWEQTGAESAVEVEKGPVVTAAGEFLFAVTSDDVRFSGQRLICTVQLVEDQATRFESDIQPTPDGKRWRAEFRADGLPAVDEDVSIPLDSVSLYLVPRPQES